VTVLTGVIAVTSLAALITDIDVTTQGLGPALFNRLHHLQVTGRNTPVELVPIGRAVLAKYLG
jgi:hypothetical protein